jgi:hypothetical protein
VIDCASKEKRAEALKYVHRLQPMAVCTLVDDARSWSEENVRPGGRHDDLWNYLFFHRQTKFSLAQTRKNSNFCRSLMGEFEVRSGCAF